MVVETPLMKQYKEIKSNHSNSILFFRLGDFYEMFFEDAKTASKELGLTLTSRNKEKGQEIPLAGVPYHSAASYIAKLVNKGYSVAICEQVEDPKEAVGIVKREVTRIITPGTVIDTDFLDETKNNYLMCVKIDGDKAAYSYLDITTGEFVTSEFSGKDIFYKILGEINKVSPSEILLDNKTYDTYFEEFKKHSILEKIRVDKISEIKKDEEFLKDYFNIISVDAFGLSDKKMSIKTSANILNYVIDLQKGKNIPINKLIYNSNKNIMDLNFTTQRNLEIFPLNRESGLQGTLIGVIDETKTSMGSRLLKKFIKNPLFDIDEIIKRQEDIKFFLSDVLQRENIREKLKEIYDIERIVGKLILETENGRDLIALKNSIKQTLEIYKMLQGNKIFAINLKPLIEIYNLIESNIIEEAPFTIREGGIIKPGINEELDELRLISKKGKDYILEIEAREKQKTGIKGLKIKYNKVFGYFIEVTKSNEHLVPDTYIRKQTLVNCERYIFQELKEYEDKIISAKSKIESLEYSIFKGVSDIIRDFDEDLQNLAYQIAYLDVISNFAHIAIKNSYVCPNFNENDEIYIKGGRHPIVEKLIYPNEYIKNDLYFNKDLNMIILTGPNMSGKSTYMKQIALILIMAQIGSFVPAESANISLVDKIFTRIGASDDLLKGQSTFMLEMSEVANIVNNSTKKSFIILDEIGRGTSTFDGISIATAITEYIHNNIGANTIFATHYHELTELEKELDKASNYRIEVKEKGKEIIFTREIVKGGADKSYGIEVARLSGLPAEILTRSKSVLKRFENRKAIIDKKMRGEQMMLFVEEDQNDVSDEILENEHQEVLDLLENSDIDSMSPIDALNRLNELKKLLKS